MSRFALLCAITGFAVLLGYCLARFSPGPQHADSAFVALERPLPLPPFSLRGARGAITAADLRGGWWWVAFGYTNCPDICPTTLAGLAAANRALIAARAVAPRVLFVSVDPARDSPALLQQYVSNFDDGFVGASGSRAELEQFAAALGASISVPDTESTGNYAAGHSSTVALLDPDVRLYARVQQPFDARLVAHAFALAHDRAPLDDQPTTLQAQ